MYKIEATCRRINPEKNEKDVLDTKACVHKGFPPGKLAKDL